MWHELPPQSSVVQQAKVLERVQKARRVKVKGTVTPVHLPVPQLRHPETVAKVMVRRMHYN